MNTYSFSRLSSWDNCKLAWRRSYIDKDKGEDNFFSRYGVLAHDILERVDKGEIAATSAASEWNSRYPQEVGEHSERWMDNWRNDGTRFFAKFTGFRTKPIWVEQHITIDRGSYLFQGYVDRLSMDGELILMTDHKCSKPYEGDKLKEKARQMYLYADAVRQEMGRYPDSLIFFHFRQNKATVIPFDIDAYDEAWAWADRMVAEIEQYKGEFPAQDRGYFCQSICNFRNTCTARTSEAQILKP